MTAVILFWMLVSGHADAECPGWLGLGYLYHPPGHGHADGWIYVQQIAPGGPSARSGVVPGDVVSAMNGQRIRYGDLSSLMQRLSRVRPGETVRLTIHRGPRAFEVRVKAITISSERCRAWRDDLILMQPKHP